jgi:hypothetical protein
MPEVKRHQANVVQTENVVGVFVCKNYGVHYANLFA